MRVIGIIPMCFIGCLMHSSGVQGQDNLDRLSDSPAISDSKRIDLNVASQGVFVTERTGSTVTFAYGVDGMRYMKSRLDDIIGQQSESGGADTKHVERLKAARSAIVGQLESVNSSKQPHQSLNAEESGFGCSVSYDAFANVGPYQFWNQLATAGAGFQQKSPLIGPGQPGTATLTTYAKSENQYGSTTDSDQVTYSIEGFDGYVEADTVFAETRLVSVCTTGEAIATINFSSCPAAFVGVSETDTMACD